MGRIFKEFNDAKWEEVRTHPYYEQLRNNILRRAQENIESDPPRIKFSMIHDYVVSGNREKFENVYESYFGRLNNLFSAYMLSMDDKYIEPLADIIWNICDMESWSIPAHVAETLSVAQRRNNLDLCSTIAGLRVSEVLYFIGDKLPELVVKRAKAELRYRVIDSYAQFAPDRYWWPKSTNNWSAVCIAAVLGTYLYAAEEDEIQAQLPRMIESAECYLSGFDDDGCCLEGYGYWNYGFSFFCVFASLLAEYTDGRIDLFKREKVKKIAKFQESITLNESQCVSFSDGPIEFRPQSWLSHFLKGVYPELRIPAIPCVTGATVPMRYILWQNPDMCESSLDASEPVSFRYDEAQWFIYRCESYSLACKAGYNNEPHNHNDVGSFIVSKGDRVTFCDLGVGEYTRQYFAYPDRYEILVCSSRGHSVPIINGSYQVLSKERSQILAAEDKRYTFTMQNGYDDKTLTSLTRDFVCNDEGITLTDSYSFCECPSTVTERFVSLLPIEVTDNAVICGDTVLSVPDMSVYDISLGSEIVDRKQGRKETAYFVDFTVKNPTSDMKLVFDFK